MEAAANKKGNSHRDHSHHVDAQYRTELEDDQDISAKGGDTVMDSSRNNSGQNDSYDTNYSAYSVYQGDNMQDRSILHESTEKHIVRFVPCKKARLHEDMKDENAFVSDLFSSPLNFSNKWLLASVGSVEKNSSKCEKMTVKSNIMSNTKLHSMLTIENAPKIDLSLLSR